MSRLTTHLIRQDDHGALLFHPDCPTCRADRLYGRLSQGQLISPRACAGMTSTVLAFSGLVPAVATAATTRGGPTSTPSVDSLIESDQSHAPDQSDPPEGARPAPEQGAVSEAPPPASVPSMPSDPPETTTGGPPDPGDQPEVPTPPSPSTSAPPLSPPAPAASGAPTPPVGAASPPATPPVGVASPAHPPTPPLALPPVPPPAPGVPGAAVPAQPAHPAPRQHPRTHTVASQPRHPVPRTLAPEASGEEVAPTATVERSTEELSAVAGPSERLTQSPQTGGLSHPRAASKSRGHHTVREGESLWTIARYLGGRGASDGDIAREVSRLWSLNAGTIRTGNSDLIYPGQVLRTG